MSDKPTGKFKLAAEQMAQTRFTGDCTCNAKNRGATEHSSTCLAANRPLPATGKWTVERDPDYPTVRAIIREGTTPIINDISDYAGRLIVKAHNAALAAEQERFMQAYRDATDAAVAKLSNLPATGEWTEHELNDLIMDLRVETGYPENIHRRFYDRLKPWFDKHNAALAAAYERWQFAEQSFEKQREQFAAAQGAAHHMEACRALLKVPDDEVLYGAIEELQGQLKELEYWKQSAIDTMPDYQAIGEALTELRLGESIHDKILPAIQERNELRKQLADEQEKVSLMLSDAERTRPKLKDWPT